MKQIKRAISLFLSCILLINSFGYMCFADDEPQYKYLNVNVDGKKTLVVPVIDHDGQVFIPTESACEMAGFVKFESNDSGNYFCRNFVEIIGNNHSIYVDKLCHLKYDGEIFEYEGQSFCSMRESLNFMRARYRTTDNGIFVLTCHLFPVDVMYSFVKEIIQYSYFYYSIDTVSQHSIWAACAYDLTFNHKFYSLYNGYRYQFTKNEYEDILCDTISVGQNIQETEIMDSYDEAIDSLFTICKYKNIDDYTEWYGWSEERVKDAYDEIDDLGWVIDSTHETVSLIRHAYTIYDLAYGNIGGLEHALVKDTQYFKILPHMKSAAKNLLSYYNADSSWDLAWSMVKDLGGSTGKYVIDSAVDELLGADVYTKIATEVMHIFADKVLNVDKNVTQLKEMYALRDVQEAAHSYCVENLADSIYDGNAAENIKYGAILYLQAHICNYEQIGADAGQGYYSLAKYMAIDDQDLTATINNLEIGFDNEILKENDSSNDITPYYNEIVLKELMFLEAVNAEQIEDWGWDGSFSDGTLYEYDVNNDGLMDYIVSYNGDLLTYVAVSGKLEDPIHVYSSQYHNTPCICQDDGCLYMLEAIAGRGRLWPFSGYDQKQQESMHWGGFEPCEDDAGNIRVEVSYDGNSGIQVDDGDYVKYLYEHMNMSELQSQNCNLADYVIAADNGVISELSSKIAELDGFSIISNEDINSDGIVDAKMCLYDSEKNTWIVFDLLSSADGIEIRTTSEDKYKLLGKDFDFEKAYIQYRDIAGMLHADYSFLYVDNIDYASLMVKDSNGTISQYISIGDNCVKQSVDNGANYDDIGFMDYDSLMKFPVMVGSSAISTIQNGEYVAYPLAYNMSNRNVLVKVAEPEYFTREDVMDIPIGGVYSYTMHGIGGTYEYEFVRVSDDSFESLSDEDGYYEAYLSNDKFYIYEEVYMICKSGTDSTGLLVCDESILKELNETVSNHPPVNQEYYDNYLYQSYNGYIVLQGLHGCGDLVTVRDGQIVEGSFWVGVGG